LHSAVFQHLDRCAWQDGKLPNRTDGETPFLPVSIARAELQENGVLAEHWDVIEDEVGRSDSRSGLPMFGNSFPP